MKRRNATTNISIQHALERNTTQSTVSNFTNAVKEFLRHCRIKGLSPDTVKFYDKELKKTGRAFAEINAPLSDIRKMKTSHIELFIEHQLALGRAVNTINSRLRAGRTFFNF
ncbi:site-specific integrase [Actinomycetes bacterium NPDC127524]